MRDLAHPFDALVSFHYFQGANEARVASLANAGCRLIGDSGAFSAMTSGKPINLDDFAGWAERNRQHLAWTANLDAIGDPDASWANWRYLARHGLPTVPTVHFGTPATELDRYADQGVDFIGLGGVAHRKDRPAVLRWLVSMFRHARDHHPQMRFHGWGLTAAAYMAHLPFYSVDSSGFGAGYRYGQVTVWNPQTGRNATFATDGKSSATEIDLLRRHYGASAKGLATSGPSNRHKHVHLTALSAQYMTAHYTARHRVTPPSGQGPMGTRVHWVDSSMTNLQHVITALNKSRAAA